MNDSEERFYFFNQTLQKYLPIANHPVLLVLDTTACLLVGTFNLQYFQSH